MSTNLYTPHAGDHTTPPWYIYLLRPFENFWFVKQWLLQPNQEDLEILSTEIECYPTHIIALELGALSQAMLA